MSIHPARATTSAQGHVRRLLALTLAFTMACLGLTAVAGAPARAVANPPAQPTSGETVVSLTFDDGTSDQLAAANYLRGQGLAGTFYITSSWTGAPGYLTQANLGSMALAGHEIGGHTVTHPDLAQVDPEEARRQICNNRATLQSWGFPATDFAYPYASSTPAVEKIAQECGYNTARGLGDTKAPFDCADCDPAEAVPPEAPYYLKAPSQVTGEWTLAHLQQQVIQARQSGGGWVILTFHKVCSNIGTPDCPTDISITPQTFQAFSSWLARYAGTRSNNVRVRTVDQQVRAYLGNRYPRRIAAVPVAPRPPATPGTNAVSNPSLETMDSATTFPKCFQPSGWGTNTPSWSIASPGFTGNNAELLKMAGRTSGDAKLMPTMDLGTCAPTVTPGTTYKLSTMYTGTATSQFTAYYRDKDGKWFYWSASPWFSPSDTWKEATFTTPQVPANATGVSFGLAAITDGTLSTDDYAMVAAPAAAPLPESLAPQGNWGAAPYSLREHSTERPALPGPGELAPDTQVAPHMVQPRNPKAPS